MAIAPKPPPPQVSEFTNVGKRKKNMHYKKKHWSNKDLEMEAFDEGYPYSQICTHYNIL